MGQHQQKEQRQQWAQHQLPSSCVPKGIYLQDHSHSDLVRSIHGLVPRSNHHNTARGSAFGSAAAVGSGSASANATEKRARSTRYFMFEDYISPVEWLQVLNQNLRLLLTQMLIPA